MGKGCECTLEDPQGIGYGQTVVCHGHAGCATFEDAAQYLFAIKGTGTALNDELIAFQVRREVMPAPYIKVQFDAGITPTWKEA